VPAGRGVRLVGVVLKGLVELIAAPRRPIARAGGVGLPIVPGLLGEVSRASIAGNPTVPVIDLASWSTVRVAEASVCASPLIAGASAFVRGVKAFAVGVRGFIAGAVARPTRGALFFAERSVGATAFVTAPVVATRAAGCVTGAAAFVTAGSFVPGVPVVAEVGALGVAGAAALVTGAAAFVTGSAARMTALLVFAADAAASSAGVDVPGAGTVAFGAGALGLLALEVPVPLAGDVAWLTGSATCWTVDATGCVA
jgi:hypothetical protein